MIRRHSSLFHAAIFLGFLLLASIASAEEIELSLLSGIHTGLDSDLQPIQQGPLTIRVTSPEHQVEVYRNLLSLAPTRVGALDEAILDAKVEVELGGSGTLLADLEAVGTSSRFSDRIEAPRQTLSVRGRVKLERLAEGYRFTVVEAPESLSLAVESAVAGQIVGACEGLARIPLFAVDCGALDRSLSRVTVKLPKPGEQFMVENEQLTADERAFFDRAAAAVAQ